MHKKLLEKLTAKCKDMGLSTESIQQIAEVASNGLADDATDEDVEARANQFVPVLKIMQGEATRWVNAKNKPSQQQQQQQQQQTKPKEADDVVQAVLAAMEEKYGTQLKQQTDTISKLQEQLATGERKALIAGAMKRLGLTEKDMEFVSVPADANVDEYLGKYKQNLVDRGLKPADSNVSQEAKTKAESDMADAMLKQFGVE
ncbi:hypothetical protein [uncultured Duncaniella sp.]|uniref:hypothetical protein n=1 Tax=uncultured Duncaniella sp. TaxID=2768039 RepID=UPI002657E4D0|nr:hypothetical protein [uncultured Duncaniella sp.]